MKTLIISGLYCLYFFFSTPLIWGIDPGKATPGPGATPGATLPAPALDLNRDASSALDRQTLNNQIGQLQFLNYVTTPLALPDPNASPAFDENFVVNANLSLSDVVASLPVVDTAPMAPPAPPPVAPTPVPPPVAPPAPPKLNLISNGDFNVMLTSWTSFGASVTSDSRVAINGPTGAMTNAMASGFMSKSFSVPAGAGTVVQVGFRYRLLSNPAFTAPGFFEAFFQPASGPSVPLLDVDLSMISGSPLSTPPLGLGATTFPAGSLVSGVNSFSQMVSTGPGVSTLNFDIFSFPPFGGGAAFIDDVTAVLDPPLHLIQGRRFFGPSAGPLVEFTDQSATFDSALVACCPTPEGPAVVSLSGPLLKAERSDLNVPFSAVGLLDGSTLTTTSSDPLVWLKEGKYSLSVNEGTAIFDFWGNHTTVEPETGVQVGSGKTVTHGGPLLEASGGTTVDTAKVLKLDRALLEATAPILRLVGSETAQTALASSSSTIELIKAKMTSLGPVIALDRSLINVTNGALVSLAGGSYLNVTGDLLSLINGSKINIHNGPLIQVTGTGSLLNVSGALVHFGGTGGNKIIVNNSIVPSTVVSGLPVNASGGNVAIGPNPVTNPDKGSITVNGSLISATNGGTVKISAP